MPTTYSHYKFGKEVKELVSAEAAERIAEYRQLYDIGLHGPDILFYYNTLIPNQVNYLGKRLHHLPAAVFFENAAEVIRKSANQNAAYAYVYGFICHFALDVSCHGYVQEKIDRDGISHLEIEAEMDRELMLRDGWDPCCHKVTGHLCPNRKNAEVIQAFFPLVDERQIHKTLKDMVMVLNLLVAPTETKRKLLLGTMKLIGQYEGLHGLIINRKKNPLCDDSTEKLLSLYEDAKKLAVRLIESYAGFVRGTEHLDEIYQYDFVTQKR